jgi:hypothetical protein
MAGTLTLSAGASNSARTNSAPTRRRVPRRTETPREWPSTEKAAWSEDDHLLARIRLVDGEDNAASRAHPAGGRRKLPPRPANPRNAGAGKPCSRRESPRVPAQPGSAMTGLSRRRSRVRVPSLPSLEVPANRHLMLSRWRETTPRGPNLGLNVWSEVPANREFVARPLVRSQEPNKVKSGVPGLLLPRRTPSTVPRPAQNRAMTSLVTRLALTPARD